MKDSELRELIAGIERKIEAATATIIGGDLKATLDRIDRVMTAAKLNVERRAAATPGQVPPRELIVPLIGLFFGALIFVCGMYAGTFLK